MQTNLLTVQTVPSVFLDERQDSVVTHSLGDGDHQGRKLPVSNAPKCRHSRSILALPKSSRSRDHAFNVREGVGSDRAAFSWEEWQRDIRSQVYGLFFPC